MAANTRDRKGGLAKGLREGIEGLGERLGETFADAHEAHCSLNREAADMDPPMEEDEYCKRLAAIRDDARSRVDGSYAQFLEAFESASKELVGRVGTTELSEAGALLANAACMTRSSRGLYPAC